jgi:hypothetical protein
MDQPLESLTKPSPYAKRTESNPRIVQANLHESRMWYSKAVESGLWGGNRLSIMLWFGQGGPMDKAGAYRLFRMGAKKGDETATENMRTAEKILPASVVEAIRRSLDNPQTTITNRTTLR